MSHKQVSLPHNAAEPEVRRESPAAEHPVLPRPTYWPAALAFAITLLAWGIVTSWLIGAVGLALFVLAIAGWIGDLLHEN
jgi:hypothetical protein